VRANLEFGAVALVRGELDAEHQLACDVMLVAASEQLCRFTSEHTAHN